MNKLFLWLVSLFNPVWRSIGADPKAIYLILKAKLLMDDRGGMMMGQRQKRKKGMEYMTFIFIGIFGLCLVGLFMITEHYATAVGLGFSMWVAFIGMMLITEMSENLFDQRDLYVLLSRPINDFTLSISRILHIAVFAGKFGLCLGLPTLVYLAVFAGAWPAFVYFLLSILTIVITMTGTLVFYLLLLRHVDSAKLKKIVGYFQIVATFFFFIAYQLPSLIGDVKVLQNIVVVGKPLGFTFPGLWLGGLYEAMTTTTASPLAYAQGLLALIAAGTGLWFYIRQSRGYADRLLQLRVAGAENAAEPQGTTSTSGSKSPVRDFLAGWLTRPNQERVSFRFHWNVMLRDMGFKQRTYPSLVYLPVILVITIFRDAFMGEEEFSLGDGMMLMLLYFLLWILLIPLGQTKYSENYRSSWIFEATANPYPNRIYYGQFMAVLGMFYLPMALLIYTAVLIYWGPSHWIDILLAMGTTLLFTLVYNQTDKDAPFSRSKEDAKFGNIGPFLLVAFLGSIFGFGHWALQLFPYVLMAATVVVWCVLLGWIWYLRRDTNGGAAAGTW
ncbi:hypothetical protein FUA23_00270 [Neolewinella aurantiaca]|uniref:ABC-2 type transport system permease protein n=1 Tax=Neolewinella aurantiaca TaxID=2602767 RepID=A0A5C7G1C1_9BACT|nr:hypothetical protein [Neolewinella aurantiaca]TXF91652.1 hypothetical protein FUA23_00270 [Neolewinella aurantiaca]